MAGGYDFYAGIESQIHALAPDGWLHLTSLDGDEELRFFSRLPSALHRGEASCLAVASLRRWAFLSDDARARAAARECEVLVSGTLGNLSKAVETELLSMDQADMLLNGMIQAGYRSPYGSLVELQLVENP